MNRKVSPKYYNGLKYLMMSDLPSNQLNQFSNWVSTDNFVANEYGSEQLVKYEYYEYWYDIHFATEKDLDQLL